MASVAGNVVRLHLATVLTSDLRTSLIDRLVSDYPRRPGRDTTVNRRSALIALLFAAFAPLLAQAPMPLVCYVSAKGPEASGFNGAGSKDRATIVKELQRSSVQR